MIRIAPRTPKPGSILVSRVMGVADSEADAEADCEEVAVAFPLDVAEGVTVEVVRNTVTPVLVCPFEVVVKVDVTLAVVSETEVEDEEDEFEEDEDCALTREK